MIISAPLVVNFVIWANTIVLGRFNEFERMRMKMDVEDAKRN